MICHEFNYSTAHSALQTTIFYSDYVFITFKNIVKHGFINRLNETHIEVCRMYTFTVEFFAGFYSKITNVANGEYSYIFSIRYFSAFTFFNCFERTLPVGHNSISSWITDREWPSIF
ncbi:hypothetical protein D3C78_1530970 [compost metagenome]